MKDTILWLWGHGHYGDNYGVLQISNVHPTIGLTTIVGSNIMILELEEIS